MRLTTPLCHAAFLAEGSCPDDLVVSVGVGELSNLSVEGSQPLLYEMNSWQLWRDGAGQRVFVAPENSPPRRQITIDPSFRKGQIAFEFNRASAEDTSMWPLQDMDIRIYANWLAEFGDLILHASGVDDDGAGYAFVGPSGAGKSTLAAALAAIPGVTVLGEDTVIARRIEGQFLLFGTPWHTNPARCSPGGVPLRKLFFLDRTAEAGIRAIRPLEGVRRVMQDSFIPYYDREGVGRILDTLGRLAEQVPFYSLSYQLGSDVLRLIREA